MSAWFEEQHFDLSSPRANIVCSLISLVNFSHQYSWKGLTLFFITLITFTDITQIMLVTQPSLDTLFYWIKPINFQVPKDCAEVFLLLPKKKVCLKFATNFKVFWTVSEFSSTLLTWEEHQISIIKLMCWDK